MTDMDHFLRQIRARSDENELAIELLDRSHVVGPIVGILRQELDSLVRTIYLLSLDIQERKILINASVNGRRWFKTNSRVKVTDRDMVDLTQHLHGWTRSVYSFGCAFIHLSSYHDYLSRDPFEQLSEDERESIIEHCRNYHGGPYGARVTFNDLVPYLPRVFKKIRSNLGCYLNQLENGEMRNREC